jgi:hypothetical protein
VLQGEVFDVVVDIRIGSPTSVNTSTCCCRRTTNGRSISHPAMRTALASPRRARCSPTNVQTGTTRRRKVACCGTILTLTSCGQLATRHCPPKMFKASGWPSSPLRRVNTCRIPDDLRDVLQTNGDVWRTSLSWLA